MKRLLLHIVLTMVMFMPMMVYGQSAKIKFDNTMHDFEAVPEEGGSVVHDFTFTNEGDAALVVIDVNTNCGCTVADFPQAPIAPASRFKPSITIEYDDTHMRLIYTVDNPNYRAAVHMHTGVGTR